MAVTITSLTPSFTFEVDFTNDPSNGSRVWTDVSQYVRQWSSTRAGRNSELARTEPGTATVLLDNRDGRFDPSNTSSPYYPGVKRMRYCRMSATWLGVTYRRWMGLVELWSQEWPQAGKDATVALTATDNLKVLNQYDLAGKSYSSQLTSARVSAVLTDVGLTSSTIATGESSVGASGTFAAGTTALEHLQATAETENGLFFAEGDGTFVFQNRNYRLTNANSVTSRGTIGDRVTQDIPYLTAKFDLDDAFLYNTVGVTPSGGSEQTASDSVSIASYFARRLTRSSLSTSATDALNTAQYLVQRYADPSSMVPSVEVIGAANTAKWPLILSAVNSERFTFRRGATGNTISTDVFIERVADVVTPGRDWRVKFELSPAIDQSGWVAGDATYSLAGTSTRAVY
jgi:hypothetical protein